MYGKVRLLKFDSRRTQSTALMQARPTIDMHIPTGSGQANHSRSSRPLPYRGKIDCCKQTPLHSEPNDRHRATPTSEQHCLLRTVVLVRIEAQTCLPSFFAPTDHLHSQNLDQYWLPFTARDRHLRAENLASHLLLAVVE
jgi:hypothetical protein